ncbi:WAT1-related protein At1g43650-like [Euphorbia lathyris]|uniref:WAT1-related protein At1g43650-like n=1 Tax=Euphorbia lathyris TaxID=212925 RepID=UPI0033143E01
MMRRWSSYAAMVLIEIAYGGSNILMKIAIHKGLNQFVFVIYRHLIAMFLLAPFAFILERKQRPPMSLGLMVKIFVVSSLGTTIHLNVYYAGLAYTSATVASALSNVIPSFTFFLAFLLGMEKVDIRSGRGWGKVMGTITCIGGSMIFIFWKGGFVYKSIEERPLINIYNYATKPQITHNWIKGSALILVSHFAWSAWLIFQGVVISALVYYLQTWCITKKGPVFVAMFSPLLLIIVAIFSAIAFAERLHLGSLIGAVLIILGLYGVLWGKSKDETEISNTR